MKGKHPWIEDAAEAYGRGESLRDIAAAVGVSHETVRAALAARKDVSIRKKSYRIEESMTPEEIDTLVEKYLRRTPLKTLTAEYGISTYAIWHILNRRGIRTNLHRSPIRHKAEVIASMYKAGHTQQEIATGIGYSKAAVGGLLREMGVPTRRRKAKGVPNVREMAS